MDNGQTRSDGVAAVVVAAGRGLRAGGNEPKQYQRLAGTSVIRRSLALFARHPQVGVVQPVIHRDDAQRFAAAAEGLALLPPVIGGASRQESVRAGLEALAMRNPAIVLVHDAARPLASSSLVSRAVVAGRTEVAAVPVIAVSDTVKLVDDANRVAATLDRDRLRVVQTPQVFAFAPLLDAHRRAEAQHRGDFSDDAALAEWAGMTVHVFEGENGNVKLTTADDFARAEALVSSSLGDVRTGSGVDVHRFADGDHVMLGGVRIAHSHGLSGHSDADVVLHALVDAILGALAEGDIGVHFPPGDPRWQGASSDRFLDFAIERVRTRGGLIAHLDVNVVCEAPRIGPHRDAIRARIADIAGITIDRVAVKATTSEGLGFVGRGEGIIAFATATVRLPLQVPGNRA